MGRSPSSRSITSACPCGAETTAAFPDHLAASPSSYGPHLRALAVYLLVFQHVPVERTARLITDVAGAAVSTGRVSALLEEARERVADSLKLIRGLLTLARVRSGQCTRIPPEVLIGQWELFHHGIAVGLAQHPRGEGKKQSKGRNLLERLRDRAGDILGFADRPEYVSFTNNLAERGLRPLRPRSRSPAVTSPGRARRPGSVCVPTSIRRVSTGGGLRSAPAGLHPRSVDATDSRIGLIGYRVTCLQQSQHLLNAYSTCEGVPHGGTLSRFGPPTAYVPA